MRLRITIAMLEINNRETLQSKVNICKSDVKIDDYADSLILLCKRNDDLEIQQLYLEGVATIDVVYFYHVII